jgi:hypothetical protein
MARALAQPPLSSRTRSALVFGPFLLLLLAAAAYALPPARRTCRWILKEENGPVELLTFFFLFAGGILALRLAARARRLRLGSFTAAFFIAFGVGFLFVGMEEIAWGQWFFHWETPTYWREINLQGETTLHNLAATQGSTEVFRIIFALGGLIGIWVGRLGAFTFVAAPAVLGPLFVVIGLHSSIDLLMDYVAPESLVEKGFTRTSELVEMYVAFGGWAYLRLAAARIASAARAPTRDAPARPATHDPPARADQVGHT